MSSFKIFIVEDDAMYGEILKYHLSLNPDYQITLYKLGNELLDNLYLKPDLICVDFQLPDMTGDKLILKIRNQTKVPVIVISGQDQIAIALQLLKNGASEYVIKDDNTKELLWNSVIRFRENASLKEEVAVLKEQLEQKFSFEKTIIGQSPQIRKIYQLIEKAVNNNINVSITGETGSGKEVVAKAIHFNSDRRKKPFVTVNMAAIPRDLIESELFGHEKGAFTGALNKRKGKFEEANGGTIFLDEIAELDLSLQSKILRVLQEREVTPVGGNDTIKFDARIITATHKDLSEEVRTGKFREDLYYRIIGLPIELPPLRDRGNDVLILAKYFVDEFAKGNNSKPPLLSQSAKDKLLKYNYPGNIRELKAIVDLACVMSDGKEVQASDVSFPSSKASLEYAVIEKTMAEYNWDIIKFYLRKYNDNVLLVADKLDIGKSTIYNLIKENEVKPLKS